MATKPWKAPKYPKASWSLLVTHGYAPLMPEGQRREILRKVYQACNYRSGLFHVLYQAKKHKQRTEAVKSNLDADRAWLRTVEIPREH